MVVNKPPLSSVTSSQSRTSVLHELIDGLSLWTLKQPFYHLTVHLIFSIYPPGVCRLFAFHVPALIGYLSFSLVQSARSIPIPTVRCDFKEGLLVLAKQWYFIKFGTSPSSCTFVLGLPKAGACAHEQERALFVVCR